MQIYLLVLDDFPQVLDEHVVAPAALAVHRDTDVFRFKHGDKGQAGELATLIGVEDPRCTVATQRLLQGIDAEVRGERVRQASARKLQYRLPPVCSA